MSYYAKYLQRLVGGSLPISRNNIEPGHIVSFRYTSELSKRKLNRLILVLGKYNKGNGLLLHGLSIEFIPEEKLYAFLKRVIIKDTLALIKRKYEIKGPFSQLIDRPKSFYTKYIKPNLLEYDCYRTYKMYEIKQPKCYMLDWKRLKIFDNTTKTQAKIGKYESLNEVNQGKLLLNKILKTDITTLNNSRFRKLIIDRFGDLDSFYELLNDIKNFTDKPGDNDEFDATKT